MNLPLLHQFIGREDGQSLILIAGGFAMLLGAVALSVDWGYSFATRRAMTNAGQAAALASGRLLASSAVVGNSVTFDHTEEQIYAQACAYAQKNLGASVEPSSYTLTLQFLDTSGAQQAIITEPITSSSCNTPNTSTAIPTATRDLRATVTVSYSSIFAGIIGTKTIMAAGSARSRIGGGSVSTTGTLNNGTPWAMVRHYDPTELVNSCGSPCDPSTAVPVQFWGNVNLGNFKGLIEFSRYSQYEAGSVAQLMTSWDSTGSAPNPLKASHTSPTTDCTSSLFDTAGTTTSSTEKQCTIPNFMYYGFWGTLSLLTDWTNVSGGQHAPTAVGARTSGSANICTSPPTYLYTPSCGTGNDHKGDWVETYTGANAGNNISAPLTAAIQQFGSTNQFSNVSCGGSCTYGKALTVMVYLWDCAEQYSGGTWTLIQNQAGTNCADMSGSGNCNAGVAVCWQHANPTPNRVHLFTFAPFTFYEGLVSGSSIQGFWGGGFASPDSCPSSNCALNALSNTTFLVGDP